MFAPTSMITVFLVVQNLSAKTRTLKDTTTVSADIVENMVALFSAYAACTTYRSITANGLIHWRPVSEMMHELYVNAALLFYNEFENINIRLKIINLKIWKLKTLKVWVFGN